MAGPGCIQNNMVEYVAMILQSSQLNFNIATSNKVGMGFGRMETYISYAQWLAILYQTLISQTDEHIVHFSQKVFVQDILKNILLQMQEFIGQTFAGYVH